MSSLILLGLDTIFFLTLAYYLMTNLQWYHYSLMRVITKHHKQKWHLFYFAIPLGVFALLEILQIHKIVFFAFFAVYWGALLWWVRGLDKPLKWTERILRFFLILIILSLLALGGWIMCLQNHQVGLALSLALFFSLIGSNMLEMILFQRYKKKAQEKILTMTQLKIIVITASYGKTSIKNYLYQILKSRYFVYATPRSVNTLKGIVSDINTELDTRNEFYIVEAGARQRGDIAEIIEFLNPQFVIIGKIGSAHLEYFGSLNAIIETKFEALHSKRLKYALVESNNLIPQTLSQEEQKAILKVPQGLRNIQATLEGTHFELLLNEEWVSFETSVLGSFNACNIALCIEMAKQAGMSVAEIANRVQKLEGVEHRLKKIVTPQRLILDDSFNGNLEGMKEAIRISSTYQGRKVIITPGVVESTDEANIELAKTIDQVFDVAIITGELNAKILSKHIQNAKKILLKDKNAMENMLKASLKDGDLVLFANDAPSYI